jgi:hypothetical protein
MTRGIYSDGQGLGRWPKKQCCGFAVMKAASEKGSRGQYGEQRKALLDRQGPVKPGLQGKKRTKAKIEAGNKKKKKQR